MGTQSGIGNIELSGSEHGKIAVSCEYGGARFHLWINRETLQPVDNVLYKNPPSGTEYQGPGYFKTRQLDQTKGLGKTLVPVMLAAIPGLHPGFLTSLAENAAQAERERQATIRLHMAREAALVMLDALKGLSSGVQRLLEDGSDTARTPAAIAEQLAQPMAAAEAAIAQATGAPA